jgi:bifunctional non-homologous end joining protein LigD
MALGPYRQKRRFGVTSEPRGRKASRKGYAYVIQKHAARRLHYDLRLELDGVMKSWAVTRGPSLVPGEKRLAIQVEDHPIDYNAFEGTIPKGEYGGGTVMIWDRGTWEPVGDPRAGYQKGHLDFRLQGEKLGGEWHLVRMRKREGERQQSWLLIKADDDAARSRRDADILVELPLSVVSGRSIEEIAANTAAPARRKAAARSRERKVGSIAKHTRSEARKDDIADASERREADGVRRAPMPDFVKPCLALLSDHVPDDAGWLHEIKFDGYRVQAWLDHGKVTLRTRTGLDWTRKFAAVAKTLKELPAETALIDGEVVVETERGISSFSALQEALKSGRGAFRYYAFDLLYLNGFDLRGAPLVERKKTLWELMAEAATDGPLRYSEDFDTDGSLLLKHACRMSLEGIISKRREAPYRSGRPGDWIKAKCTGRQEFVVAGFTPASNDAKAVGALILGYYENGKFEYAGRVGTGFTRLGAKALWKELEPSRRRSSPFAAMPPEEHNRGAVWVEPRLVAEIDFTGWTHGKRLRHPSFQGLRHDKRAIEVVREANAMPPETSAAPVRSKAAKQPNKMSKRDAAARMRKAKADVMVAGIALSNPDRVYWQDVGVTKQALAEYYVAAWDWVAPHVTGRVLSLLRCPEGAEGDCFFQKHATAGLEGAHLRRVPEDGDEVIAIDGLGGLIALVQAGVLEVHVRGSRVDRLDAADRVVFDLDPGPDFGWPDVKRAAIDVRDRLEALGLKSFLKTTGGKGLHVVVPIDDTAWDVVKKFAREFAQGLADAEPNRFVAMAAKNKRAGRIFIDYLRNSREATAIVPYSTRARPGATVSVPLAWSELQGLSAPNAFTVANVPARLRRLKSDPWSEMAGLRQRLPGPVRSRAVAKK